MRYSLLPPIKRLQRVEIERPMVFKDDGGEKQSTDFVFMRMNEMKYFLEEKL
jgi:hypothetical protein